VKAEKQAVILAEANTFAAVSADWLDRRVIKQKRSNSTIKRARLVAGVLNGAIGNKQLNEIEPPELLQILRRVEARGHHDTAVRMRAIASSIFGSE